MEGATGAVGSAIRIPARDADEDRARPPSRSPTLASAGSRGYHRFMSTAVKRLDLTIGELVEVAGRRYEVVPDREGGVTIGPPITPVAELHARRGIKPASADDFERLSIDVPFDDEG
jgi:hypothetical protein